MGNKLCTCSSEEPVQDNANLDLQVPRESNFVFDPGEERECKGRPIPGMALDKTENDKQSLKLVSVTAYI
jgi:hypothetical protein